MCSSTVSLEDRGAGQPRALQDVMSPAIFFFSSTSSLPLKNNQFLETVTRRKNSGYTDNGRPLGTALEIMDHLYPIPCRPGHRASES